jgi:serine/threonine-protein kinase
LAGFRIIQELGRSPQGVIYKARRLVEQDVVAVKVFRDSAAHEVGFRENLQRNAEASFLLEHPGLVRCLGCLQDGHRFLLVEEYARGEPLSRALQRNVRFLPPRALALALQCAEALGYAAERKRFHCRLHPGDLIVNEDEARVLGVGLGEQPEHAVWQAKDPHLFEPLAYTAPEAMPSRSFAATETGRRAADLYSLGAVLYHMLTGTTPFRGTDEGSLAQERAALSPLVVRWPRGTERSLPARAIALVERLLSPDPLARGDYSSARVALSEALREAEGGAAPPLPRPAPVLPPVEIPSRPPQAAPPRVRLEAPASLAPVPPPPAAASVPRPAGLRAYYPQPERSPALLIGAVAVVLAYALGLATRTFLLTHSPANTAPVAQAVPPRSPEAAEARPPGGGSAAEPRLAPTRQSESQVAAAQKLKLIRELLEEGAAKYDNATLRELHDLSEKAGEASRVGLEARLLINEVEEKMARAGDAPAKRPAAKSGTEAEERVFQELVNRAKDLATQQRFGDALAGLKELPPALKLAPYPERAAQECALIEQQARAAFAELSLAADQAVGAGDYGKARGLYQTVQVRWGMPAWAEAAAARVKAVNEAEEKAFQTQAALRAQKARARELAAVAVVSNGAAVRAYQFQYGEAKEQLEKFARGAQDAEARKLATDYAQLVQDESWLYELCRKRLGEQIQRDPAHSSPLQIKNKDGQPLYDITDFTPQGLKVVAVRGGAGAERVLEWRPLDPLQPFVMAQILVDKSSAQERLALAALAFHQSLRAEGDASWAEGSRPEPGKEDAKAKQKRVAATLKNFAEAEMNGAVQADANAREKQVTQRALLQRLAELLANPPPAEQP